MTNAELLEAAESEIKYLRGREAFLERFVLDVYDIVNDDDATPEEKVESVVSRLDQNAKAPWDGLDGMRTPSPERINDG